jgi:hypothetical protein
MDQMQIFIPVLIHITLVIGLYILLVQRKVQALKNKLVDLKITALNNQAWPADVVKVSNNIANQFETPVLFYMLCTILVLLQGVDVVSLVLAWVYVVVRIVHIYIHVGSNYVPRRLKVFAVSLLVLLAMLIKIAFLFAATA